jgi:hypothetical protein
MGRYLPRKMEQTECSETWAYKIQTPGITQKKAYKSKLLHNLPQRTSITFYNESSYVSFFYIKSINSAQKNEMGGARDT